VDDDESSMKSSKAVRPTGEIVRPTDSQADRKRSPWVGGPVLPACRSDSQADRKRSPWVGGPVLPACRGSSQADRKRSPWVGGPVLPACRRIVRPTGGGRHGLAVPCCLRAEG
jgi:hypothetical protein